jgi:hypothetical protein
MSRDKRLNRTQEVVGSSPITRGDPSQANLFAPHRKRLDPPFVNHVADAG